MRCIDEKKNFYLVKKLNSLSRILRSFASPDLWLCYCDNHLGKLQNLGREST